MAGVVDADTHVLESAGMWELFDKEMYPQRPVLMSAPGDTLYRGSNAFWLIDGNIFPKPAGKGGFALHTPSSAIREVARTDIPLGSRELTDPETRLRDMDRLGIDIQVVFPTLFIIYLTDNAKLDAALCRAYNRWMAQQCARGAGRIRFIAVLPMRDRDEALKELQAVKELGAVGLLFRGIEGEISLADPYFFPIYEEASRLNLPICVHTGAGCPAFTNVFDIGVSGTFSHVRLLPLIAFRDIVANKIPERFPELRIGFIEAGASWVPYLLHQLKRLYRSTAGSPGAAPEQGWGPRLFRDYRLFVACEADEDLPYLLRAIGEDNILIGSDYGHQDPSEERAMVDTLRAREDLPRGAAEKLLCENARRFYPL